MKRVIPLLVLLLLSCGPNNIRSLDELQTGSKKDAEYIIQPGDTLNVSVWGEPRLSGPVVVREDGRFTLPLVEDISADGQTVKQLTATVTERLSTFIPAASVSISVSLSAPVHYYLSGQFVKPGEYKSERKITLLQAISTGGGFAPFADESEITLIRRSQKGELRYQFDYNRVVDGVEPNPELKSGDLISVK